MWTTDPLDRTQLTDKLTFSQKQFSPTPWPWLIRSGDGKMKKAGQGPSSLRVCGSTQKKRWQEDRYSTGYRKSTWGNAQCPWGSAQNWVCAGCRQEQFSSRRKKFEAWYWISKSMFRAWYDGAYCGSQRPRTWIASWEVNWKSKSTTKSSMVLSWTLLWNHFVGNAHRSRACWPRWPECYSTHTQKEKKQ